MRVICIQDTISDDGIFAFESGKSYHSEVGYSGGKYCLVITDYGRVHMMRGATTKVKNFTDTRSFSRFIDKKIIKLLEV